MKEDDEVSQDCLMCQTMLQLMAQQSSYQLHVKLLDYIKAMSWVSKVSGFEVRQARLSDKADARSSISLLAYADQSEHEVHDMAKHASLLACLEEKNIQYSKQGMVQLCFVPVLCAQAKQNVWVIEYTGAVDDEALQSIFMLAKIYHHCEQHISAHRHDSLTGLENRQALTERLGRLLHVKSIDQRRAKDHSWMPSLCILDIDFFKRVNDNFGHLYGDEVLLLLSRLMKKSFRETDYLYRYGGEEFVALLDTKSKAETETVLERFRQMVNDFQFPQVGHVTVSIGFVQLKHGSLPSSLFDQADKALYYAKQHGRNQVRSYQDLLDAGLLEEEQVRVDSELF